MIDPLIPECQHVDFDANVGIHRLTDEAGLTTGFHSDITVRCRDCRAPFVFLGLPIGVSLDGASVSVDGQTLKAALAPSFAWVGAGKDSSLRGFVAKPARVDENPFRSGLMASASRN